MRIFCALKVLFRNKGISIISDCPVGFVKGDVANVFKADPFRKKVVFNNLGGRYYQLSLCPEPFPFSRGNTACKSQNFFFGKGHHLFKKGGMLVYRRFCRRKDQGFSPETLEPGSNYEKSYDGFSKPCGEHNQA